MLPAGRLTLLKRWEQEENWGISVEDSSSFVSSSSEPKWRYRSERAVGGKGEAGAARDTQSPRAVLLRYRRMVQPHGNLSWNLPGIWEQTHAQQMQTLVVPTVSPKAVWSQQEFMHLQEVSRLSYIPFYIRGTDREDPNMQGCCRQGSWAGVTALHP